PQAGDQQIPALLFSPFFRPPAPVSRRTDGFFPPRFGGGQPPAMSADRREEPKPKKYCNPP
ncbi:MAG: hypothetical protein LUF77_04375, partial [Oscillospiraceae bacterium]|nr:hypothetical protein [Oscillospiraceae bacterium]